MPKIKTRKAVKKRVKLTGTNSVTHLRASRAHKLTKKSAARKRAYTVDQPIAASNVRTIKKMLGK